MTPKARRWMWPLGALALLIVAFAAGEASGWRFLAGPSERWLSRHLQREVRFGSADGPGGDSGFRLSLLGRVRLQLGELEIANPAWSRMGPMVQARQAALTLRYRDLIAARDGDALQVAGLQADGLQLRLERRQDGQASWQFGARAAASPERPAAINGVHFESLVVRDGQLQLADAATGLQLDGQFGYLPGIWNGQPGWTGQAQGRYQGWPVMVKLRTGTLLPEADSLQAVEVPLVFSGGAGQARLEFDGKVRDLFGQRTVAGRYQLRGPSLAAVGDPLGVTLPSTPPFVMKGHIQRDGDRWTTHVDMAEIGRSRLAGDFDFRRSPGTLPILTGELRGQALWLQDLGPAIGTRVTPTLGTAALPPPARPASGPQGARVLPDRPLDLPSLSVMQADVRIKLDRLELGHPRLESMRPLRAHLTLKDAVLTIDDLDATLAKGRVWGRVTLDGRQKVAVWNVDLSANDLRLEQWISQSRGEGKPPYVAGELAGRIALQGRGRSVAELLGSSSGNGRVVWSDGTLSHLVLEAAGIDLAQAIGVMLRGDEALPVTCGAADLLVKNGQVEPRLLVVDTRDSTVWGSGSLSLADERLDLVAHVAPKDISPLALRTPLHVRGTLGDPDISLEKGPLARRAVPALLLGLVNPLAALLPLIDTGSDEARERLAGCYRVAQRGATAHAPAPKPSPKKPVAQAPS
jgi:AsmA family protein